MSKSRSLILKATLDSLAGKVNSRVELDHAFKVAFKEREFLGVEPTAYDELGFTILHWAAVCDMRTRMLNLLKNHTNDAGYPNFNLYGFSPLTLAAESGFDHIVKLLIHYECNPLFDPTDKNAVNLSEENKRYAKNPLDLAIENKQVNVVDVLLIPTIKAQLAEYNDKRKARPEYDSFFINSGYSKSEKMAASCALSQFISDKKDLEDLTQTQLKQVLKDHPALGQKKLGEIYNRLFDNLRVHAENKMQLRV